jgi:hypothetical protein
MPSYKIISLISLLGYSIFYPNKSNFTQYYKIGCAKSMYFALKIFYEINKILKRDNHQYSNLFRPISNLQYEKVHIDRTLYFLEDSILFSNKQRIVFNNFKLKNEIHHTRHLIEKLYVNVDRDTMPKEFVKNVKLGLELKRQELKMNNNSDITKIIYWRNKEQWMYYSNNLNKLKINISYRNHQLKVTKQSI